MGHDADKRRRAHPPHEPTLYHRLDRDVHGSRNVNRGPGSHRLDPLQLIARSFKEPVQTALLADHHLHRLGRRHGSGLPDSFDQGVEVVNGQSRLTRPVESALGVGPL